MEEPWLAPVRDEALPAFASAAIFLIAFPPLPVCRRLITLVPVVLVVLERSRG